MYNVVFRLGQSYVWKFCQVLYFRSETANSSISHQIKEICETEIDKAVFDNDESVSCKPCAESCHPVLELITATQNKSHGYFYNAKCILAHMSCFTNNAWEGRVRELNGVSSSSQNSRS